MTELHGTGVPGIVPKPISWYHSGKRADAALLEDDLRDAAIERERADGDDQRRQHRIGDHQAVERRRPRSRRATPTTIATSIGKPALQTDRHRRGAKPDHRPDRDVDLAGDDDQRHRQGEERHRRDALERDGDVRRGQEILGNLRTDDEGQR